MRAVISPSSPFASFCSEREAVVLLLVSVFVPRTLSTGDAVVDLSADDVDAEEPDEAGVEEPEVDDEDESEAVAPDSAGLRLHTFNLSNLINSWPPLHEHG